MFLVFCSNFLSTTSNLGLFLTPNTTVETVWAHVLWVCFWGSVIVCMCAPLCLIFVLGWPVFIVGPATHCLRELRLQALFLG